MSEAVATYPADSKYSLQLWSVTDLGPPLEGAYATVVAVNYDPAIPLGVKFRRLRDSWINDTLYMSSLSEMVTHPAYLEIIGMGWRVVPRLLEKLRQNPRHWFTALTAITGENPIPLDAAGNLDRMTQAWLEWGAENGYL